MDKKAFHNLLDKNVMVIIDENLSPSTSKHISALCGAVPGRVHVFRCHLPATYWEWNNVHFIDRHAPFDKKVRMQMVELYATFAGNRSVNWVLM